MPVAEQVNFTKRPWLSRSERTPGIGYLATTDLRQLGVQIGEAMQELHDEGVDIEHMEIAIWKETPPWVACLDWRPREERS